MLKKTLIFILSLLFFSIIAQAQKGKIAGKIIDKKTGEDIIGATISIEGTTNGTSTDIDGKYILNVEPGKYTVLVSYVSYKTLKFENVEVKAGEVTNLSGAIEEASTELGEVEIIATFEKGTQALILTERKNAAQVSDGISADVIRKTPDRNSSDVLKRITGVSIQDNKFAIIRGLADRYNAAFINGAPLPSTESDRKAFAFDMFPSQLLESMTIIKTATPDMVGDWAGGVINIKTKDVPEKKFFNVGISGTHNSITTFKSYQTNKGGSTDWLGIDDGTRQLPSNMPSSKELSDVETGSIQNRALLSESIKNSPFNDWALEQKSSALPNMGLQISGGTSIHFTEKSKLGVVGAITYNNSRNFNKGVRNNYTDEVHDDQVFIGETRNNLLSGAMLNFAAVIAENHKISFKNVANINTENRLTSRDIQLGLVKGEGIQTSTGINRWYTENRMYTSQLSGEHYFKNILESKFKWVAGYGLVDRNIPSMRYSQYEVNRVPIVETRQDADGNDIDVITGYKQFNSANISNGDPSKDNSGFIFSSRNNEKSYSFGADYSIQLPTKGVKSELKVGGYYQLRNRLFNARQYAWSRYQVVGAGGIQFDRSLTLQSNDSIFAPQNIGLLENGKGGFIISGNYLPSDTYNASSQLRSGFAMMDNRVDAFRIIWGARIESYNQILATSSSDGSPIGLNQTINDVLPSANFVYEINEKTNLRIAYYKTVSRPEFRELAPFSFFDYSIGFETVGEPNLKRAKIDNIDLRVEFFPGAGQVIAVTGFFKNFTDPIEQYRRGFNRLYSFINAKSADVMGIEFEYRQNIGNLFNVSQNKILTRITPFVNFAYMISNVNTTNIIGSIGNSRPLQGQSPYILNAGIQYQNDEKEFSVGIMFNQVGRRIFIVGAADTPNMWENPRPVLDLNLSKSFFNKKLELRLSVSDLIAQDYIFYSDMNKDGKFNEVNNYVDANGIENFTKLDLVNIRNNAGRNIRLGAVFNF